MRGHPISLEARRLIFGQDPAGSRVGDMECALGLINIDGDFDAGYLDAAYLVHPGGLLPGVWAAMMRWYGGRDG